jgi:hypothetical protein
MLALIPYNWFMYCRTTDERSVLLRALMGQVKLFVI